VRRVPFVILLAVLVALALDVIGCTSEETDSNTAETSLSSTTTATEAMASTTTTALSGPVTTELPAGGIRLDNGNVQVEGYMLDVTGKPAPEGWGLLVVHLIPTPLLTDEEYEAAILKALDLPAPDPSEREVNLELSPMASFTVSTLAEGGEQTISLEEFLSIWSASPLEGGEDLAYGLWSIEYGEDSVVVSITEEAS
jgi:hypothetical protein